MDDKCPICGDNPLQTTEEVLDGMCDTCALLLGERTISMDSMYESDFDEMSYVITNEEDY